MERDSYNHYIALLLMGNTWEGRIPSIFIFPCLCCCTKRIVSWLVSSRMSTQTTTAPHRPSSNAISRPMPLQWTSLYLDRKRYHSIVETSWFATKIWHNLPLTELLKYVLSKLRGRLCRFFAGFSENLNFTKW